MIKSCLPLERTRDQYVTKFWPLYGYHAQIRVPNAPQRGEIETRVFSTRVAMARWANRMRRRGFDVWVPNPR